MTVPVLFALVGSVILVGFLANLLFRLTKIPSVLVLIGIGVVLGPVTGWIRHDWLLTIAPYFGAAALLVILFEGGLELELEHVVRHAPLAAAFAGIVFALSTACVAAIAHVGLGMPVQQALMLGAILGATSPAICMPVVSGLSVRNAVKTVIKLESAMGEVLLIVSVVLLIHAHHAGSATPVDWAWGFARSLVVALLVASVAGVLWSRLVGWLGREPLAYMLTLGMVCLLYFAVEELGGSPAIAVLLFGLLLANMQAIAGRIGPRVRHLFGIDVREEQFVLGQFMVNITAELSFLVRTFFFVYLGLLLDLSALSWSLAAWIVGMFLLLLASRRLGILFFRRAGGSFDAAEWQAVMALQPRGLATAVVALMPAEAGVAGTAIFPLFAFVVIVLSNLYMTGGIVFAERRLRRQAPSPEASAAQGKVEPVVLASSAVSALPAESLSDLEPTRAPLYSPARDFEDEAQPSTLTDWTARAFGLRRSDREAEYVEMIRASYVSEPLFWVQTALGASICALGLLLGQTAIVIGGALIVPLVRTVIATGLAVASGDLYLLTKLTAKLAGFGALTVALAAVFADILPFAASSSEIVAKARPTILDFLVALFGGMSGAALVSLRRGAFHYLPGAVVAITLLPPLCVMGFGMGGQAGSAVFTGAALQFSANLFAAVLGAGLVLLAVGVPLAAESQAIRQWKEEALAQPLARTVFGTLGLQRVIGRTGSVRARLIVIGVFLLLLLTPLQQALNHLTLEFRTRQAIATAQSLFVSPGRSVVMNSAFTLGPDETDVRLQIATNRLYASADIGRFEERVSDQTGRPCRLNLVQTVGDVGDSGTLQRLLSGPTVVERPRSTVSIGASMQELDARVSRAFQHIPLPASMEIVAVRPALIAAGGVGIEVAYLAPTPASDDAASMILDLVAAQLDVPASRLSLAWVPSRQEVTTRRGRLDSESEQRLRELRLALAGYQDLTVSLLVPSKWPDTAAEAATRQVADALLRDVTAVQDVQAQSPTRATVRIERTGDR